MTDVLIETASRNLGGIPVGVCSICSAHALVLKAAMADARDRGSQVCIESTSNQVNQFGGYTGMDARAFVEFVAGIAASVDLRLEKIILGGDHLGPFAWRKEPSAVAMERSAELVSSYVKAGFRKIHLDTSMRCAGDPGEEGAPLEESIVTERAAYLAEVCERTWAAEGGNTLPPVYVIGTEVPVPGGEEAKSHAPAVTSVEDVECTLAMSRAAFLARGLYSAWDRVIAVVVQPGVEFSDTTVFPYEHSAAAKLSAFISAGGKCVFEAHSTDYQSAEALKQMVEDHFAILKVGPWLTFAFREAVFALSMIEEEWLGSRKTVALSGIRDVLERAMLDEPSGWQDYYHGDEGYLKYARKYSYSDRCRYYWPKAEVRRAMDRLVRNLQDSPAPLTLISQYLPVQYGQIRRGELTSEPEALLRAKVGEVLQIYSRACGTG
jgi:D-tagatose-1,6-bisphosphate aldolase subunit GatZ/KbaZ